MHLFRKLARAVLLLPPGLAEASKAAAKARKDQPSPKLPTQDTPTPFAGDPAEDEFEGEGWTFWPRRGGR